MAVRRSIVVAVVTAVVSAFLVLVSGPPSMAAPWATFRTPTSYVFGGGEYGANGKLRFVGDREIMYEIFVKDRCPGDGYAGYAYLSILYTDGNVNTNRAFTRSGTCGAEQIFADYDVSLSKPIRSMKVCAGAKGYDQYYCSAALDNPAT